MTFNATLTCRRIYTTTISFEIPDGMSEEDAFAKAYYIASAEMCSYNFSDEDIDEENYNCYCWTDEYTDEDL